MAKYGKKAQESVESAMHKRKRGTLKRGSSGKPVKSRKQAIAIGLSEARRKGAKVPAKGKAAPAKRAGKAAPAKKGGKMAAKKPAGKGAAKKGSTRKKR